MDGIGFERLGDFARWRLRHNTAPIAASRADFVPSRAAFFASEAPGTVRNFCSQDGLIPQPVRGASSRAEIETRVQN